MSTSLLSGREWEWGLTYSLSTCMELDEVRSPPVSPALQLLRQPPSLGFLPGRTEFLYPHPAGSDDTKVWDEEAQRQRARYPWSPLRWRLPTWETCRLPDPTVYKLLPGQSQWATWYQPRPKVQIASPACLPTPHFLTLRLSLRRETLLGWWCLGMDRQPSPAPRGRRPFAASSPSHVSWSMATIPLPCQDERMHGHTE
jgi:hypothetical protein